MITYGIIALTCLISYLGFDNQSLRNKLLFIPYRVKHNREFHRFVSSGLVHADMLHLGFNLFVLFQFGPILERYYASILGAGYGIAYLLLYFGGMAAADYATYLKFKDNSSYRSLGASGAVSAVLLSFIVIDPWSKLQPIFFPMEIYSFYIGIAYLLYSYFAGRKLKDNINHDAHLFGAIWGILFTFAMEPRLIRRLGDSLGF